MVPEMGFWEDHLKNITAFPSRRKKKSGQSSENGEMLCKMKRKEGSKLTLRCLAVGEKGIVI